MIKRRIIILVFCCSLILFACSPKNDEPNAQATIDAVYTSVMQTLAVAMPSSTPTLNLLPTMTPAPTDMLVPTATETVIFNTPTRRATVSSCDNSVYVTDVNIPDNTVMTPGQVFTKTWSIKNVGTCNWTTSYKLVYLSGDLMSGVATNLTQALNSGHADNISVKLTAPLTKGTYTGYWKLQNAAGQTFGDSVYVTIVVSTSITSTPTGTITPTPNLTATANALNTLIAVGTSVAGTATASANAAGTATANAAGTAAAETATAAYTPPP